MSFHPDGWNGLLGYKVFGWVCFWANYFVIFFCRRWLILLINLAFLQYMQPTCLKCKGRGFCGRVSCPIYAKSAAMFRVKDSFNKESFTGSAPAPFVGRAGYPYVNVGILSTGEHRDDAWLHDAPKHWSGNAFDIRRIIDLISGLVNSRFKADVKQRDKMLSVSQEVGMASKPVDVEMQLADKPRFSMKFDANSAPMGPHAELKKVMLTENPSVDSRVEKAVSDTDLLANDALVELYRKHFDENFLTKLFSVGNLGLGKNRKFVPTRWSITAVDDTLSKSLHAKIIDYPQIGHLAYFGSYLGNYYLIMLFPDAWGYELFESYMPNASWNASNEVNFTTDYEGYSGRKDYAENCAGGYYSVRLAVLEKLNDLHKQASVLVIRVITGEYTTPLGVWVTREAARKALASKPLEFGDRELMLRYAKALMKNKFGFDADAILSKSKILLNVKNQMKLTSFT
jgi:DNA repair protein NreA